MSQKSITIAIDADIHRELERQATREGASAEAVAARIIHEGLHQTRLEALEMELRKLRKDHAIGLQVLLVASGSATPERAKRWVLKNIVSS